LNNYKNLLNYAKENTAKVKLIAGSIPRPYTDIVTQGEGIDKAISKAKMRDYLDQGEICNGSSAHFNMFESMLTGRNMHDESSKPDKAHRDAFTIQVLRDTCTAHMVNTLLREKSENDNFLVICPVE
jgi:hypothetical protein